MSIPVEKAVTYFKDGYACSQAVFAPFCGKYGLDEKIALRVSSGFGGGVKCGELCGVVAGAVMVIGLKYGHGDAKDKAQKQLGADKTTEFLRLFRERNRHLACRDLLGCDISTPQGRQHAQDNKLFTTVCVGLVMHTVEILEELGY